MAGLFHISTFIAGTKKISLLEADTTVEIKSSADPFASLESKLAVVGAINIISDHLESAIWSISSSLFTSK